MKVNDFVLVSVDDHLVEPPDMFEGHIPDTYKDDVPKLIQREDGTDGCSKARKPHGVSDEEVNKITHENALRLYSFDMLSHVRKEDVTVGALRAQAKDVDLGFRSSERLRKTGTDTVTVLDLATKLPNRRQLNYRHIRRVRGTARQRSSGSVNQTLGRLGKARDGSQEPWRCRGASSGDAEVAHRAEERTQPRKRRRLRIRRWHEANRNTANRGFVDRHFGSAHLAAGNR
jgi:hypothetical protein